MGKIKKAILAIAAIICLSSSTFAASTLLDMPAVEWTRGCSPTSASMLMAYYDINGYSNLIQGDYVESQYYTNDMTYPIDSYTGPGYFNSTYGQNIAQTIYNSSAETDSLVEFMGTNSSGSTIYFFDDEGSKEYYNEVQGYLSHYPQYSTSMLVGIVDYITYCGYEVLLDETYTQIVEEQSTTANGFSYDDLIATLDNGQPVLLQMSSSTGDVGHTVIAIGYDDEGNILFYDTWDYSVHSMGWTDYYSGYSLYINAVTVIALAALEVVQEVPEPVMAALVLFGLLAMMIRRRRKSIN